MSRTPKAAAAASRVISSNVGPRPPQIKTTWLRSQAPRIASVISGSESPTAVSRAMESPIPANSREMALVCVLTFPVRSSVPTQIISTREPCSFRVVPEASPAEGATRAGFRIFVS